MRIVATAVPGHREGTKICAPQLILLRLRSRHPRYSMPSPQKPVLDSESFDLKDTRKMHVDAEKCSSQDGKESEWNNDTNNMAVTKGVILWFKHWASRLEYNNMKSNRSQQSIMLVKGTSLRGKLGTCLPSWRRLTLNMELIDDINCPCSMRTSKSNWWLDMYHDSL
ncbi:hypothetical protein Ancab_013103 [Ancistrocladus abbreviatus]